MLGSKTSLRRRLQIVETVRKRGEVSVEELSQLFDVSSVTIRSDLNYLEQQRYLVRAFGKARYLPQRQDSQHLTPVDDIATRKSAEMAIARLAADSVDDGAIVLLGAGTLPHKVLPLLAERVNLSLLLHDVAMVATAQRFVQCELSLCGGHLRNGSTVLTGPDALRSLASRTVDLCIVAADGIDTRGGATVADDDEAEFVRAGCSLAKRIVVLAYRPRLGDVHGIP
ncbi:MAG: DeoR/GlpR family DNA-binding transcription regulator, partial [Janthinobacterium lividum]